MVGHLDVNERHHVHQLAQRLQLRGVLHSCCVVCLCTHPCLASYVSTTTYLAHLDGVPADEDDSCPDVCLGLDQGVPAFVRSGLRSLRVYDTLLGLLAGFEVIDLLRLDDGLYRRARSSARPTRPREKCSLSQ